MTTAVTDRHLEEAHAWWHGELLRRAILDGHTLEEALQVAEAALSIQPWPEEEDLPSSSSRAAAFSVATIPPMGLAAPLSVTGPTPPITKKNGDRARRRVKARHRCKAKKWPSGKASGIALATRPEDWQKYEGPRGGEGWEKVHDSVEAEEEDEPPPQQQPSRTETQPSPSSPQSPSEQPSTSGPSPDEVYVEEERQKSPSETAEQRYARLKPFVAAVDIDGYKIKSIWGDELRLGDHAWAEREHMRQSRELMSSAKASDYDLGVTHKRMAERHAREREKKQAVGEIFGLAGGTVADARRVIAGDYDLNVEIVGDVFGDVPELSVAFDGPQITGNRTFKLDSEGRIYAYSDYNRVKDKGQGFGSQFFVDQVKRYQEAGLSYIENHAARSESMNGYYTWPLLGYDKEIPRDKDKFWDPETETWTAGESDPEDDFSEWGPVRRAFPHAKSVLDVMSTSAGRAWWKENGFDLYDARFDLTPGSRSMQVLEAYMAEREARKKGQQGA